MHMKPRAGQFQHPSSLGYSSALGCSIYLVACVLLAIARLAAIMCLSSIRTVEFTWLSGGGPVGAKFSIGGMNRIRASMYMGLRQADCAPQLRINNATLDALGELIPSPVRLRTNSS